MALCTFLLLSLASLLVLARQEKETTSISYSLLNEEETITLTLSNYFEYPSRVQIDYHNSTPYVEEILNVSFPSKPVTQISSLELTATTADNVTLDFNAYKLLSERSVFNHPNKVFLMEGNLIFSIRYQVSGSDTSSYVQAFWVGSDKVACRSMEVQNLNSSYYLHVACLENNGNVNLFLYKFTEARPDFLSGLEFLSSREVTIDTKCNRADLFAFDSLYIGRSEQTYKVLLFCSAASGNPSNSSFLLSVGNNKGVVSIAVSAFKDQTLMRCLQGTTQVVAYQKGFLALAEPYLRSYSFNPAINQTYCDKTFLNVSGLLFLTEVEELGIQYVYIIYQQLIVIKESYSPNFERVTIDEESITGMNLSAFAIARRLLTLLYVNETDCRQLVFDLRTSNPKLVEVISYPRNDTQLQLFSVNNFLEIGNYFLLYSQAENLLVLNLFLGYEMVVCINDS
jgi:hypothetical protein